MLFCSRKVQLSLKEWAKYRLITCFAGMALALFFGLSTASASSVVGDLNNDAIVSFKDFEVLASYWMDANCADSNNCDGADFEPNDGVVDINDLAILCNHWLEIVPLIEVNETFYSISGEDGQIWGDLNANGFGVGRDPDINDCNALRIGDLADELFLVGFRNIVSFDTIDALPADSNIISARLELTRGGEYYATNPFVWGGNCVIDIANPTFGANTLDANDWEAIADANAVAYFLADPGPNQPMVSTDFNSQGLSLININGKTQFKFYLENSMNGDANSDYLGFYSGEWSEPNKQPQLKLRYNTTRTPIVELSSIDSEDGRIWADFNDITEQWEGYAEDSDDDDQWALRLGDYMDLYSYKTILSFDTSVLPQTCTLMSAKLQMYVSGIGGIDPFSGWGGNCYVDIATPYFGDSNGLQITDWQVPADAVEITRFSGPAGTPQPIVSDKFSGSGLSLINRTGTTQLRVYFETPMNLSTANDCVYLHSGDDSDVNKRPKLIIQYLRYE